MRSVRSLHLRLVLARRVSWFAMPSQSSPSRLAQAADAARAAEARRDESAAGEAWRRYRLIRDGGRDTEDLLSEGIALSNQALALAPPSRT